MVGESLEHENNAVVWWPTRKDGPNTKETRWPTRKLAGGKESGLQGKKLVSHSCATFQTRKTRGNKVWFKNHAKQRTLSGPESRHAAEGSENRKLVSKREKWSTTTKMWSTRPLPPSREEKQGSVHKPSQSTKISEAWRQSSQPKLRKLETSTTCTITERSIDDMVDDIPYGRGSPRVEDEPDIIPLPPRIWLFNQESTFHHFIDFTRRAPADLLLQEPESHLSHHHSFNFKTEYIYSFYMQVSSRFIRGYGSIIAREWYMKLPDIVRHIVDEVGLGPFCAGLSRHSTSRTLLGELVERWWDITNSFHFSATGDMTMIPYDFSILTGLDVAGRPIPYDTDMGEWETAWTYLLLAHPPHCRSPCMQYARGFLMFLLGTTLFSDRGNTVGLYLLSALSLGGTFCPIDLHFCFSLSVHCTRHTLHALHYVFCILHLAVCIFCIFCILTATVLPFTAMGSMPVQAPGDSTISPAILRHSAGDRDHLAALAGDAQIFSIPVDDLMLGSDAVLFLEEREYATYCHTYLMPPLTGVRTLMRRAADMPSSNQSWAADIPLTSRASTSRGRARGMPSTYQYAGWPDLPTELTGWQYGTSYSIPLEPPLSDHRYVKFHCISFLHLHLIYILADAFKLSFSSPTSLGDGSRLTVGENVEHLLVMTRSLPRRMSQHIHSQRHLQAEMTTPVPVLRAEVTPRRIPRTVTPIQMVVPTAVVEPLGLELDSTDADATCPSSPKLPRLRNLDTRGEGHAMRSPARPIKRSAFTKHDILFSKTRVFLFRLLT
ncbi:hypothetical protein CsSME_00017084 [Camellia sinensis var. sinensis]